mmetsp:Transcript_217/g.656  ORF Transcript_217/g.656 Transcript_217/m.656 type:complete len:290 (+) Transcript_217:495-1364(+)
MLNLVLRLGQTEWWCPSLPQNAHSSVEVVLAMASLLSCCSSNSVRAEESREGLMISSSCIRASSSFSCESASNRTCSGSSDSSSFFCERSIAPLPRSEMRAPVCCSNRRLLMPSLPISTPTQFLSRPFSGSGRGTCRLSSAPDAGTSTPRSFRKADSLLLSSDTASACRCLAASASGGLAPPPGSHTASSLEPPHRGFFGCWSDCANAAAAAARLSMGSGAPCCGSADDDAAAPQEAASAALAAAWPAAFRSTLPNVTAGGTVPAETATASAPTPAPEVLSGGPCEASC